MKITPKRLKEIINEEVGKFVKDANLTENEAAEGEVLADVVTSKVKKVTQEGKTYIFTDKD